MSGVLFDLLHNSKRQIAPTLLSRSLEVASGVSYLRAYSHPPGHQIGERLLDDNMRIKVAILGSPPTPDPSTAEAGTYRSVRPRSSRTSHMISSATSSRLECFSGSVSSKSPSARSRDFRLRLRSPWSATSHLSPTSSSSSPLSSSSVALSLRTARHAPCQS